MPTSKPQLPYWDGFLDLLAARNAEYSIEGLHAHYGCWDNPAWSNRVAEHYGLAAQRMCDLVCEAAGVAAQQRVLDVGCGVGTVVGSIDRQHQPIELIGLNIDLRQLRVAQSGVRPTGENQIAFVAADGCVLPYADRSFDVVLALECTMHFASRERFLREVRRVLRPGGRLALCEHFAQRNERRDFDVPSSSRIWGSFLEPCTVDQFRRMAEASGLRLVGQRDVSQETVPTFPMVRRLLSQAIPRPWNWGAFALLLYAEVLVRTGRLYYKILTCESPG